MALTQNGTQRIEIIVRKGGGAESTGAKDKEADKPNEDNQDQDNKDGTTRKKGEVWWRTQLTHTAAVAKQIATLGVHYHLAGIAYKTGDQALQSQVERQVEIVSDTTNIATSVAMGATYGAAGGTLGSIAGALMMGTQTAATTIAKYMGRERDYEMEMFKQNNAIEYKRARAQINLTTGRLR